MIDLIHALRPALANLAGAAFVLCVCGGLAAYRAGAQEGLSVAGSAIDGLWRTQDGERLVEIGPCGLGVEARCGSIVWLQAPADYAGQAVRDAANPDARLRKRPLCEMRVLWGFLPTATGVWDGGSYYEPDRGATGPAVLVLDGDMLQLKPKAAAPEPAPVVEMLTRMVRPVTRCSPA